MSFGRRTTASEQPVTPVVRARPATRRGGYPLGLLAVVAAAFVGTAVLAMIPALNPRGTPVLTLLAMAPIAILNVAVMAAMLMLVVDLLLRALNWRRPWIYALFCGVSLFVVCYALSSLGGRMNPVFVAGLALWPGAAGGWVMGLFRR